MEIWATENAQGNKQYRRQTNGKKLCTVSLVNQNENLPPSVLKHIRDHEVAPPGWRGEPIWWDCAFCGMHLGEFK